MNISEDRVRTIYRFENNNKTSYSIGLSRKKQDGSYENGYMMCRFPKDADIKDRSKIKIKEGWLDFYLIDKKTIPYIFIFKYELEDEENKVDPVINAKSKYDEDSDIQLTEKDLPF